MSETEALPTIRGPGRRGAYREAAAFADALPSEVSSRPAVALERARVRMRRGRMNRAREALLAADAAAATEGEKLILALEATTLHTYCNAASRRSLEESKAAFASAGGARIDAADWAEAERIHSRIPRRRSSGRATDVGRTARRTGGAHRRTRRVYAHQKINDADYNTHASDKPNFYAVGLVAKVRMHPISWAALIAQTQCVEPSTDF